jgi:hypothetical protein
MFIASQLCNHFYKLKVEKLLSGDGCIQSKKVVEVNYSSCES